MITSTRGVAVPHGSRPLAWDGLRWGDERTGPPPRGTDS